MLKDKLTLVIHSCDKFSDLWDAHFRLLEENWSDRNIETFLVTDRETSRSFSNVGVICAGEGAELSERTQSVLQHIKTEYMLITLDDYFPIYPIDSSEIENIIREMDSNNLDYVRIFKRPASKDKIAGTKNLYRIDLNSKKDSNYQVNLYVGIWRKSFVEKTIREPLNSWAYELSLSKIAREVGANCAMTNGSEFRTLDVVRKGQLLHKASRYLKKHELYHGERTVINWKIEAKYFIFTFFKDHTPQAFIDWGKGILRKKGHHFYSDDQN